MSKSVLDPLNRDDHTKSPLFLGRPVTLARYDKQKYPWIDRLTEKQLGFFWRPEEVELVRDSRDFKNLTVHEQHIFTSNLKRQILLDSVQGRAPLMAFGTIVSNPELETFLTTQQFFETIHSRSYTQIIRNVYPDPSKIFDEILDISEIVECAGDISESYDSLIRINDVRAALEGSLVDSPYSEYDHKRAIWMALMGMNILEGIRFYVSFACSWAFAETKRMEGNAKIIKFIARDENIHLAFTQHLLKVLPQDDPVFASVKDECWQDATYMFESAVNQEKIWAEYLFKDGSMIGLTESLLKQYVEWIANKRMAAVGLDAPYKSRSNPLPWTQKWIAGSDVQVAPQETEVVSYVDGNIKKDVDENTLKSFSL